MKAAEILEHVATTIASHANILCRESADATLAGGTAGVAIAAAYIRRWQPEMLDEDIVRRLVVHAIASQDDRGHGSSLYFGSVGVAWMAEHLKDHIDCLGQNDICSELDETVAEGVGRLSDWRYEHELFRGLVGLGVYLLERPSSDSVQQGLNQVTSALIRSAERTPDGLLSWRCDPVRIPNPHDRTDSQPYFNLGVPHGIPGPIVLLARAGRRDDQCTVHCDAAMTWFLQQRSSDLFPCFGMVAQHRPHVRWLQPAWCYGDLGIAGALGCCAMAAGRQDWLMSSRQLGKVVANLVEPFIEEDGTSLCHGSAGNAQMFARLYQYSGDEDFRSAALHWYRRLLRKWNPDGPGFAGFLSTVRQAETSAGFLRGAAGAALCLLAAISDVSPDWDRLLLLST
jgi:hypothetical protein